MSLGTNTLHDLDVSALAAAFKTYTKAGATALRVRLETPLTDVTDVQKRQAEIRAIRDRSDTKAVAARIEAARTTLRNTEADVVSVAEAAGEKRHAEYYSQILWPPDSRFAWLNQISWVNEAIVFFRTIFLPGMALVLPLIVFLAPLFVYYVVLKQPLTLSEYFALIQTSLKKAMPSVLGRPRFAGRGGFAEAGEQFVHLAAGIAMFVASIWNQISAARSMRSVVADMRRRAEAVERFTAATVELGELLGVSVDVGARWSTGALGVFGDAWNQPERVRRVLEAAGHLDMLAAIAARRRVCFPKQSAACLRLTDIYHPSIAPAQRVYNSVTLDATAPRKHVLLTGPNRGGKSTFLKSLGAAVLMHQTIGVVFARKATMPVFAHIITALSPADKLGEMSLFEAEIEFAKQVRERVSAATPTAPIFLMMDEIFHGTNAHDGVEASQVFLDDLYGRTEAPVFSVVSTHYMDLPRRYGEKQTQNLCMDASVDPADADRLIYTYTLKAGVNQFSSVREILRERGLLG